MSKKGLVVNGVFYPFTYMQSKKTSTANPNAKFTDGKKFYYGQIAPATISFDRLIQESFIDVKNISNSDNYHVTTDTGWVYTASNKILFSGDEYGSERSSYISSLVVWEDTTTKSVDTDIVNGGYRRTPFGLIAIAFDDVDGNIVDCGIALVGKNTANNKYDLLYYVGSFANMGIPLYDDTYNESKDSTPDTDGGGDGGVVTGKNPNIVVGVPDLPDIDVSVTGNTLYSGNAEIIKNFTNWLWSDAFIDNIKKMYSDPSQAILGFGVVDANIVTIRSENIHVGNLDTGVIANRANAWQQVDCGSMKLYEVYGAYTDYSPYVDISLYLPKIGVIDVDPDIVMNNEVHIVYNYELVTGSGICYILIKNTRDNTESIYKYIPCRVVASLPWSLQDRSQQISAMINACTSTIMGGVTGGGAGAGMALAQGTINVLTATPRINSGGNLSGVSSLLGCKYPYFIIKRASVVKPYNYNKYHGYKLYASDTLSNHKGLTKCVEPRILFGCPKIVEDEIKSLLESGVIV